MTVNLAVAHGLTPGLTYAMSGFTTTPTNAFNATFTALQGTAGQTLVGTTGAATCPTAISSEGLALSGTGASIAFPAISSTNPFSSGGTGITTKSGQHICGMIGENGDDLAYPGSAWLTLVDDKGNALPGSPALVPNLNQSTANFTGYVLAGAQSPSTPALNVTAMNPYTITSASYNTGANPNSTVTFNLSSNPGFVPGSEFTVSGLSPSSVNGTYVAIAGTTGNTVAGNPLSGPMGTLQPFSPPGTITTASSPQLVSGIMPGMIVLGTSFPTANVIAPFGTDGGTGTGGTGSYALSTNQAGFTFSGRIDSGTAGVAGNVLTLTAAPFPTVVVGETLVSSTGAGFVSAKITGLISGTGGTGTTYTVDGSTQSAAAGTITTAGTIGSSLAPVTLFAYTNFYYFSPTLTLGPSSALASVKTASASIGDFVTDIGTGAGASILPTRHGWGGALANFGMLYGPMPMQAGGAPNTTAVASLCKKQLTIPAFAAANGMTVHSLYPLNDIGIFGDASYAQITGYVDSASNTSGGTATLHVLSTATGSLALPANATAVLTGPGLAGVPVSSPAVPLTTSAGSNYTITFAAGVTSANVGSASSPVAFSLGQYKPAAPITSNTFQGYIDSSPATTLHVMSLDSSTHSGFAKFAGTLSSQFTGSMTATTGVLTIGTAANAVVGVGTIVNSAPGAVTTFGPCTVTSLGTGLGGTGTYNTNCTPVSAVASELMDGTGPLPTGPTTLNVSGVTGTIAAGMVVTDGGASLTAQPLLIQGNCGTNCWTVTGNYYPAISADANMTASLTTIVPGEYLQNTNLPFPVKVLSGWSPCGIAGASYGGLGCYTLSTGANGAIASAGSPATFVGTTITDGGAIAPGLALTISDQGPGVTFPIDSGGTTGHIVLSGTYDAPTLGGTPSSIQVLVSQTGANGPPISSCSPCNWGTLSGSISGGKWSGSISGIPAGGPYSISVRAGNGQAYATLPNTVKVGLLLGFWSEGQGISVVSPVGGFFLPSYNGLWGTTGWNTAYGGNVTYDTGPAVDASGFAPAASQTAAGDRFGILGTSAPLLTEGMGYLEQTLSNAFAGEPVSFLNYTRDGIGIFPFTMGNVTQTQTISVGDGTTKAWCSLSKFCSTGGAVGKGGPMLFNAASLTGASFTGSISGQTLTVGTGSPTWTLGALEPGMVLTYAGAPAGLTLQSCTASCGTATAINGPGSTWTLSASPGNVTALAMRADPTAALIPFGQTTTPWPAFNAQLSGVLPIGLAGFGTELIKAGTFSITVNGTPVCQDGSVTGGVFTPAPFAYNNTGGNCVTLPGSPLTVSTSFVNYQTGDYQVTLTTAPASNAIITASWTNIISPEGPGNSGSPASARLLRQRRRSKRRYLVGVREGAWRR